VGSSRRIRSTSPLLARRWKPALSTADNAVVRGVIAPSTLVQPVLVTCRRGSGGIFSAFQVICTRSRCGPRSRHGDRPANCRRDLRFRIVSSDRTTRQVDQVPHAAPVGDFLRPTRMPCERSATRSDTSAPQTHQPIWIGRSPSRKSPGV
jgi:hypothetical protein